MSIRRDRLYVTNATYDRVLAVDIITGTVIDTISAGDQPNDICVNHSADRVYVANETIADGKYLTVERQLPIDAYAAGLALKENRERGACLALLLWIPVAS